MYQSKIAMKWASQIIIFIKRLQCENNIQAITNCQNFRFRLLIFSPSNAQELLLFYSSSLVEPGCRNRDVSTGHQKQPCLSWTCLSDAIRWRMA